jgi:hypothetical protein
MLMARAVCKTSAAPLGSVDQGNFLGDFERFKRGGPSSVAGNALLARLTSTLVEQVRARQRNVNQR